MLLPRAREAARAWRERLRAEALVLATAPDLPAELRDAARELHDLHCSYAKKVGRPALRAAERRFVKALGRLLATYDLTCMPPAARRPVWDPLIPRELPPAPNVTPLRPRGER